MLRSSDALEESLRQAPPAHPKSEVYGNTSPLNPERAVLAPDNVKRSSLPLAGPTVNVPDPDSVPLRVYFTVEPLEEADADIVGFAPKGREQSELMVTV